MKNDARGAGMNAVEFVKKYGWEESQHISSLIMETGENVYGVEREDLHGLVESYELVQSYGGLAMAKRQYSCFANASKSVGVNQSPRVLALGKAIAYVEKCQ
ncbi:hypothetical protein F938_00818 [Acinetobacter bereziniae LMG 1003 = CIP 70.12]|uniref:Uncharacterized protein n=1 Tax=Acinetobacter bereziniae LMG 1003 = CIP 70.12 TaxID=981324 RepID=N9F5Q6_ACIBZ|nr:hypothetical protein [Acinetobacter bereziniae]ENW00174.1 hypothetical protein F938_00818 [Acinetobacter bereziniae LMG 1003 = CIP 70.12]